jgi:hypothetical protein
MAETLMRYSFSEKQFRRQGKGMRSAVSLDDLWSDGLLPANTWQWECRNACR